MAADTTTARAPKGAERPALDISNILCVAEDEQKRAVAEGLATIAHPELRDLAQRIAAIDPSEDIGTVRARISGAIRDYKLPDAAKVGAMLAWLLPNDSGNIRGFMAPAPKRCSSKGEVSNLAGLLAFARDMSPPPQFEFMPIAVPKTSLVLLNAKRPKGTEPITAPVEFPFVIHAGGGHRPFKVKAKLGRPFKCGRIEAAIIYADHKLCFVEVSDPFAADEQPNQYSEV